MIFLSTSEKSRFKPNKLKPGDMIYYPGIQLMSIVLAVLIHDSKSCMTKVLTIDKNSLIQRETINLNYLEIL